MKVLVLSLGTRGDVQPFLALAVALRQAGHDAVLAAPHRFAAAAAAHAVPFAGLDEGPLQLAESGGAVADVAGGRFGARLALIRELPATFARVLRDCWAAAGPGGPGAGAQLVVHNGQVVGGPHVAEKLAVPAVLALTLPMYVPTRAFPWPGQSFPEGLPSVLNRVTYAGMKAPAMMFGKVVDAFRAELGLPRSRGRHDPTRTPDGAAAPVLHAVSPQVLPRPADWPDTALMTGYWQLPAPTTGLAPELEAFLAAGPPPVYVGFGSMTGADPETTTRIVLDAVDRAGVRAVLATGWGGLSAGPQRDDVLVVDEAPHELLFPQVAAVVHHGGAGTTAAAVTAGRPQVICPFVADQPFWGRRMHQLGVAATPIPQRRLSAAGLGQAIAEVMGDPSYPAHAEALGHLVRAENGVAVAIAELERIGTTTTTPHTGTAGGSPV